MTQHSHYYTYYTLETYTCMNNTYTHIVRWAQNHKKRRSSEKWKMLSYLNVAWFVYMVHSPHNTTCNYSRNTNGTYDISHVYECKCAIYASNSKLQWYNSNRVRMWDMSNCSNMASARGWFLPSYFCLFLLHYRLATGQREAHTWCSRDMAMSWTKWQPCSGKRRRYPPVRCAMMFCFVLERLPTQIVWILHRVLHYDTI